jgi:polyisoprenyl-teichoic acid--peptidoglycan teichoic acid transferase
VIVAATATATALAGLIFFERLADRIEPIPEIARSEVPHPEPGGPRTLLLLGSDRRPGIPDERSDTTMLLRLDPAREVISLLSLPRDLLVPIPGVGRGKLNLAYTEGGPRLVLRTVRDLTGLEINEVVDVDFQGFADAVNAVDCVYVDVDRKYFIPPEAGIAEIDIKAGYQRLCGLKALQYVRYRHDDNDVVRAARQQAFLREARQRLSVETVALGRGSRLLDAFTDNTRSTIEGAGTIREIAVSLFELRGASVEQIRIVGDLGEEDIRAGRGEIERAVERFLGQRAGGDASPAAGPRGRSGGEGGRAKRARDRLDDPDPQLARYAATAARRLEIASFHPTRVPAGTAFSRDSRTYDYEDEQGRRHDAYKLVMSRPHPQIVTEHFGIAGTTWRDPPILRNPSETREIDGREYLLFFSGETLRLVGWRHGGSSYWLSNSLLGSLSEAEMIGTASSVARA